MSQMVVNVELCKEDRERLDKILTALQSLHCETCVQSALSYYQAGQTAEPVAPAQPAVPATPEAPAAPAADPEPVKAEEPAPAPAPAPEPAPAHTKADIQRKVVELSAAGKKGKVREIVTAYAAKVSAIPDDKVDEVWDKLTALEG